ncbi:MAG: hypothetical protein DELT_03216 [Desulfovibrio sp.]
MAAAIEHAFEVDAQDRVKVLFLHTGKKAVAGNARVVDKHVDGAEGLHRLFHHRFHFIEFAYVRFDRNGFYTLFLDFRDRSRVVFLLEQVVDHDIISFFREAQGKLLADAA